MDLSCTTGRCLQVQLPLYIDGVREKLAENLHELWAMRKVEQGWSYDEVRSPIRVSFFKVTNKFSYIVSVHNKEHSLKFGQTVPYVEYSLCH